VDFGCGVGRLTLPLARISGRVTGIDISQVMLDEARRNCDARGVTNVELVTSEAYFSRAGEVGARPDFVYSYIVFQHIPVRAGLWMADALVARLCPGGIGALHFTYARRAPLLRRVVNRLRRRVPGVNLLANVVQGRPLREPLIPMNTYDLGDLLTMLGSHGCSHVHARLTDHGGHLGAMLLFRKDASAS
jgi:SAM-dependent methyltransferase